MFATLDPCVDVLAALNVRSDLLLHTSPLVEVWRATLPSGERAALKLLKGRWLRHPTARAVLRREHDLISSMQHPHIVRVVDFFEHDGCCALATEYLDGGDLVPLTGTGVESWIDAACALVAALEHVHARGYVHGDVKARNVLFTAGDRARLIDFGSAAPIGALVTQGGRTPEHEPQRCGFAREWTAEGARITPAMDVYSLAVLLYELLSGRLPFAGPSAGSDFDACAGATRGAERLLSPLKGADSVPGPILALAERVTATLLAGDANGVGTLMQFSNVLESVKFGYSA